MILEELIVEQRKIDDRIGSFFLLTSVAQHNRSVLHSLAHFLLTINEIEAPMLDALR